MYLVILKGLLLFSAAIFIIKLLDGILHRLPPDNRPRR